MIMTKTMQHLILTPKSSSPLGAVPMRPDVSKFLDPRPDIDLIDIRLELQEIESTYAAKLATISRTRDAPVTEGAKRFGGNISDVADFGRRGFRMGLFESELYSDDMGEAGKESAAKPVMSKTDGFHEKEQQDYTPLSAFDVDRAESKWAKSPFLPKMDQIETALHEVNRERLLKVQEEIKQTQVSYQDKFKEEQQRAAVKFIQLERDVAARHEKAQRTDKQDQRLIAEARDHHLSILQRDHEQRSQVEERAIRKEAAAEEARRRELERVRDQQLRARQEAEAVAKKKAEAERDKAAAEVAKRKAQADAAAAAALQRAEIETKSREQKAKLEAEVKAKVEAEQKAKLAVPKPRVSEQAAKAEDSRLKKLQEFQDVYNHFLMDPVSKKDLKVYERQLVKHLQQVSATQEQVRKKSSDLINLFQTPNGPPIQFLIVTLASKLLSQCESQVQKLPSFAFALAQVVVNVASRVPFLMDAVLAQLHQVCIFTVPKYYVFSKSQFASDEAYYKALGYKEEDGKLESTDAYVARMNAYMTFFAALTQTEVAGGTNPYGMGDAWTWCTRLLNRIPANRLTASALDSFLKVAGFRLFQMYPKPFMKLMQVVVSEFLVSLKSHEDADARTVVYRLETYLHTGAFRTAPEGRNMPVKDSSSYLMA